VLAQPDQTAMDLHWTMFGISVRVNPMFWLTSALIGYGIAAHDLKTLVVWVFCVFVSVLLHELGHVLMGRVFGSNGQIVLMAFGGLALGATALRWRWQRILVVFAGPGIQLLVVPALFFACLSSKQIGNELAVQGLYFLLGINLVWPIFNLLPIWPLDGGQITREVCDGVAGRNGIRASLILSILLSGALALDILMRSLMNRPLLPIPGGFTFGPITALFFLLFAFSNLQELGRLPAENRNRNRYADDDRDDRWDRRRRDEDDLPWERPDDRAPRGSDDRVRHRPDDGYRRRDDDLPWER
jgi:stage IV sporulation protein FB